MMTWFLLDVQKEYEMERRKNHDLADQMNERNRLHQKLQSLYDKLKRKTFMVTSAQLEAPTSPPPLPPPQSGTQKLRHAHLNSDNFLSRDPNSMDFLHQQQHRVSRASSVLRDHESQDTLQFLHQQPKQWTPRQQSRRWLIPPGTPTSRWGEERWHHVASKNRTIGSKNKHLHSIND